VGEADLDARAVPRDAEVVVERGHSVEALLDVVGTLARVHCVDSAQRVALLGGSQLPALAPALLAMLLGFASYGLSILAYVWAQRGLGAARTSAYYAIGPFIGVAVAWALFGEAPGAGFLAALVLMALGSWLSLPKQ